MKVLQLCHKPPFPPVDGGCIAMNNITQGLLAQNISVKIITASTFKHPINIDILPDDYLNNTNIETVFIDTQIKITDAFFNFFSNESYNVKRFFSKEFEKKIASVLSDTEYDIIQLESLFVTPYLNIIRKNSGAKIVLRSHNVEFEIWEKARKHEQIFFKKKYLQFLTNRIKKYELKLLNKYDGIATISDEDKNTFIQCGCRIPVENIPLGINISEYQCTTHYSPPTANLFFLASMDWRPNSEGLEWFFENVWQQVHKKNFQLKFNVAGRAMPEKFLKLNLPNVKISGEISDAKKFFQDNDIMVVPLFSGSGVRVKIIEAMAMGKVVISTSTGAKGINCEHKKNILIADSPSEFSEMVSLIIANSDLRKVISNNARKFAEENYDNCKITEKLISFYKKIIEIEK